MQQSPRRAVSLELLGASEALRAESRLGVRAAKSEPQRGGAWLWMPVRLREEHHAVFAAPESSIFAIVILLLTLTVYGTTSKSRLW